MSLRALLWAFDQPVFPATHKLILLGLANYCGDTALSYPKVSSLCGLTSLTEETIRGGLAELVLAGWIKDTGKRTGHTRQIKIYGFPDCCAEKTRERLDEDSGKTRERPLKTGVFTDNSTREQEQEQEQAIELPFGKFRFKPPTIEAIKQYGLEISLPARECERFFDYYEAYGWSGKRGPMKKWRSALQNWKRTWEERHASNSGPSFLGPATPPPLTNEEILRQARS